MGFKRAVSPLIASILLISLTVSLGALIIGWGQQYVKKQTQCMGMKLDIQNAKIDTANNQLLVTVFNSGSVEIDTTATGQNLKFVTLINGQAYTCKISSNSPGANECVIQPTTNKLAPGDVTTLTIRYGSGLNVQNIQEGYFAYGVCGEISRHIYGYEITT